MNSMRIGLMGDLHLRDSIPKGRMDPYPMVLLGKFNFILDFCDKHGIKILIQPGDFFESVLASVHIMRRAAGLLRAHAVKVHVVYGQHDLRYHASDTSNVPLQLFEDFNLVKRLHPTEGTVLHKTSLASTSKKEKRVVCWGSSWNEEIPDLMDPNDMNIWATHRMVIDNEKLWDGMKDYTLAKHLLKKNPFALIVTGDNHRSFVTKYGLRYLINCGSLGRTNIDQAAHIPHFMVFDTVTKKLAKIKVPIRPPKEVLKIEEAKERKKTNDPALDQMMGKIFIAAESKAMKLDLSEIKEGPI
jgi:DNA repair exonuclease SbcCD nuclease subunit